VRRGAGAGGAGWPGTGAGGSGGTRRGGEGGGGGRAADRAGAARCTGPPGILVAGPCSAQRNPAVRPLEKL
jgi:hypothetical protein